MSPFRRLARRLRPEALAALPEDLRAELMNAVVTLDIDRITAVIRRIAELDAALGSALMFYLQRRTFT